MYAFSRLCLASHPSEAPIPRNPSQRPLFNQARRVLDEFSSPISASNDLHSGFSYDAHERGTLQSLIDQLPDRREMDDIFDEASPHYWAGIHLLMFGPGWREDVDEIYAVIESGRQPSATQLAGFFAFLSCMQRATETAAERNGQRCDTTISDRHARHVMLALELDEEGASFDTVRALVCLV